jgi:hypothetical protein
MILAAVLASGGVIMRAFILVSAVALSAGSAGATSLRVYHIGNSVTDTFRYDGLGQLASAGGHGYAFGRHMIPGAPLSWIYEHPNDGFREPSGYATALPNLAWDALTLQPFDRQLGTPTDPASSQNDLAVIREYLTLLRQNAANHDTSVFIYSRWPRRDSDTAPINFQQKWNRTYTGGWDGTNESRDYFERVTLGTRQVVQNLGGTNPVHMIPVGDVLNELDLRMEAGQVPGYTDIVQVYADGIHFTNVGAYIVALTFYATMYQADPTGLPVPATYLNNGYSGQAPLPLPPALAASLQDAVWDVVNGHPYSGVNVVIPEPATLSVVLGAAMLALRRV